MVTECERIIAEGIIPADYLKEEVRCDFLVDTNRKKLWAILLDLLVKFDNVCKKHNLRYFLIGGTLLGAVRHNGFIPWDDDVDVIMPREDYVQFLQLGNEFKDPYFLQTIYSDNEFLFSNARLRNSNTTFIQEVFRYQNMNQGIFIDILPLDVWNLENGRERRDLIKKMVIDNSTHMRLKHPNLDAMNKKRVAEYVWSDPLERYETIQKLASQDNLIATDYVSLAVCTVYDYEKHVFRSEDFHSSILYPFETYEFPIPIGYKRILNTVYGDYLTFPSIEKRGTWHGDLTIDPDTPYVYYLREDTVH